MDINEKKFHPYFNKHSEHFESLVKSTKVDTVELLISCMLGYAGGTAIKVTKKSESEFYVK